MISMGLLVAAAGLFGLLLSDVGPGTRILLLPSASVPIKASSEAGDTVSALSIVECAWVDDGLRVVGKVWSSWESPARIAVSGVDESQAGIAVSPALARRERLVPEAQVGDFVVTIPWADYSVQFSLLSESRTSEQAVADPVSCPP